MHFQVITVLMLWYACTLFVLGRIMTLAIHLLDFHHLAHHTSLQNSEDTRDSCWTEPVFTFSPCLTGPTAFCTSDLSASWLPPTLSAVPPSLLCSCLFFSTSTHEGVQAQTSKFFFSPRGLIHSLRLNTIKRLKRSQSWSPALNFTSFKSADATNCLHDFSASHCPTGNTCPLPPTRSSPNTPLINGITLTQLSGPTQLNSTPPVSMFAYNKPILPIISTVAADV